MMRGVPGNTVTIVAHDVGGVGGMERQLQELIAGLVARDIQVFVVSRTLGLEPHPLLQWRRVPGPTRPFVLAYPWFAVVGTALVARTRRGVLQTTGAIVLNRADVCTVHYLHNGHARPVRRMKRRTLLYRLNAAVGGAMSRMAERLLYASPARTATLVAVSAQLARDLLATFPERTDAIVSIENGVDSERFQPDEQARRTVRGKLGIDESTLLALFVGSEWSMKGIDVAVEALVAAQPWHLAVVGTGDADAVRKLATEYCVEARLHLVGESAAPERYYAAADAFILPSAYESFSLAAFEAAASELPVLATNVGAIAEIINAGGGMFVERTAASVAQALSQLAASPETAAVMARRARGVSLRFGWDAAVAKYVDVYRRSGGDVAVPTLEGAPT